jgi:hypothetical protein
MYQEENGKKKIRYLTKKRAPEDENDELLHGIRH